MSASQPFGGAHLSELSMVMSSQGVQRICSVTVRADMILVSFEKVEGGVIATVNKRITSLLITAKALNQ